MVVSSTRSVNGTSLMSQRQYIAVSNNVFDAFESSFSSADMSLMYTSKKYSSFSRNISVFFFVEQFPVNRIDGDPRILFEDLDIKCALCIYAVAIEQNWKKHWRFSFIQVIAIDVHDIRTDKRGRSCMVQSRNHLVRKPTEEFRDSVNWKIQQLRILSLLELIFTGLCATCLNQADSRARWIH